MSDNNDNDNDNNIIDWSNVIKKESRGVNGEDLGEVQNVESGHVLVQRRMINKKQFFIPQDKVVDFDGSVLIFSISEDEMKNNYTEIVSSSDSIDTTTTSTSSYENEGQTTRQESTDETTRQESTDETTRQESTDETTRQESTDETTRQESTDETTRQESTDETTISLTEERLFVLKNTQEEQVSITKMPVTTTETVDVPVTHEEIFIERRPVSDQTQAQSPVTSKEIITIALRKEEVEVTKTPYVKEEIVVKKKPVTENRQVTQEVTSEEVKATDDRNLISDNTDETKGIK